MPKLKTHQSVAKRIKVTKKGKLIQRRGGQDHFNSHERGNTTRNKRRDMTTDKTEQANMRRGMPYASKKRS
ncbi:MAG: 50S ribosomal protein L35 [Patescibacteria group bacterium]|jgi:large subunit ribosomal protein L35